MENNNRAVIYARYSSDNQREESIDAQVRAITEYADKNGYIIIKTYTDSAKSATTDKRPAFQQMIIDSNNKDFDYVIVHKLDRFSRDRYDSTFYKRKLKNNKVRVLSVLENLDDSPESIILESLLESMAEYYSRNLAREVAKGMKETALQCKHTGGTPPLGYNVDPINKKLVINEAEAIIVREIYDLYLKGYGYLKIIDNLNSKGYKTKSNQKFGKNSIHSIISNEKYSGVYVFNRSCSKDEFGKRNNHADKDNKDIIRIEDGVPAIITKEQFLEAQTKMIANKKAPAQHKAKENYLLSGLIYCGICGSAMHGNSRHTGRNKNKYVSYRCGTRERNNQCNMKEIRKEYIENFVLSELEKRIFNDESIPLIISKVNEYQKSIYGKNVTEIEKVNKLIADINNKIENITNAIMNGFNSEALKNKMAELEQEKQVLKNTISELNAIDDSFVLTYETMSSIISKFKEYVVTKNIPECKSFIKHYVDKVTVYEDKVEVTFKVTSTSFITNKISSIPIFTIAIPIKKLWKLYRL